MPASAWYSEHDPFAADWLVNLVAAGLVRPGAVDRRDIRAVSSSDIPDGECHFFAGIGGWSAALDIVGWPVGTDVWTGSCPCQPYSVAGRGHGAHDERDLWPVWHQLIDQRRPSVLFGEQVASAIGHGWADRMRADLEASGYAVGMAILPAIGVGAPHRRDRLWFGAVGHAARERRDRPSAGVALAEPGGAGLSAPQRRALFQPGRRREGGAASERCHVGAGAVGDAQGVGSPAGRDGAGDDVGAGQPERPSAWGDAAWITGADGRTRRVKPGVRLLAHGVAGRVAWRGAGWPDARPSHRYARVGALKGLGNAIVPQLAAAFIEAFMEAVTQ